MKVILRARMSHTDSHYGGGLVSGAKIMELFGDAATEVLIRNDGDEGLFRAYETIEFLAPVRMGDFIEVTAELIDVGKTSRKIQFEATKVIEAATDPLNPTKAAVLKDPVLVAKAIGTCVTPKH